MTIRPPKSEMKPVNINENVSPNDGILESGLRLACSLSNAESAVLELGVPARRWIYRVSGEFGILEGELPSSPFMMELELTYETEGPAFLRLYSGGVGFEEKRGLLRDCVQLIGRTLSARHALKSANSEAARYRGFVREISEGVWRYELRKPMPAGLNAEEQVAFMFEHGFLAECNPAMARMYGYERPEEITGAPLSALLIPDDPRNHLFLQSFVRNGYRLRNAESVEKDRDGKTCYFVNNLFGIFTDGEFTGAWGTQADVTATKDLEKRLTVAADAAAEANRAKSVFLANISHEIRTPLGVILGFADLVLDKPDLSADAKGYVSAIRRNAEQLSGILGEVLDLSKIEASRMELEEIRFPLMPVLSEVVSFLDLHAREKGLALSLERKGPLPRSVKTDPTRLRQILTNLIGNAIKFTEQGFVKVSVRMSSKPEAGTPLQLEFSVSDTGIGIPPDLRDRLFRPYSQAEASTTRRFGGTGLGLMLSKKLAHALGGDLNLQASEAGHGSTFVFTIAAGIFEGELVSDSKPESRGGAGAKEERGGEPGIFEGKRVLLVEDSEDNQLLIKHYLNAVGIEVEIANNGFEGLAKLANSPFDLVVLDIQMPGMDGHQCARSMRDGGYLKPIIALTAHAMKEDRDEAFKSGFSEYLTKPINRVVLMKTLGQRLGAPALH